MRGVRAFVVLLIIHATLRVSRSEISDEQLYDWVNKSTLTFTGTIVKMGESNVSSINSHDDTMIVTVNKVESGNQEALKKFGSLEGKELTVVANSTLRAGLAKNVSAVFFVDPWVYETNIGVTANAIAVASGKTAQNVSERLRAAALRKSEAPLRNAIDSADLIVTGEVKTVRPLPSNKAVGLESVNSGWELFSEHRPRWKEALIHVKSVVKGTSGDSIIIVFPGIRDCLWEQSPIIIVGRTGTWLLHKNQLRQQETDVLLKSEQFRGREIQSYTALAPADFQPEDAENLKRIRQLIEETKR
jgi:hypothetical protein